MDTLVVIDGIRMNTHTLVLPMQQILGSRMVPVFEAMNSPPRTPLVIEVPDSFVVNEAIWITG